MTVSTDTSIKRLYYIHDPMCSWCWAFSPVWDNILSELPVNTEAQLLVGGLAPDSDQPMSNHMQEKLQLTWKQIQQVVPGTNFNFDFWKNCEARRSTYPACRAVITARTLNSTFESSMIKAIQRAYYLEARNPSNLDTLTAIAESIGADRDRFIELMASDIIETRLQQELNFTRQLGIQGFPSLVLQLSEERYYGIAINFEDASAVLEQIDQLSN